MMFCPDCVKSTGGRCLAHSSFTFTVGSDARFTEAFGEWTFRPFPICIICRKTSEFGSSLGYGSKYDGEFICDECVRQFIDPAIDKARGE